jgi:hypothetical protein
MSSSSLIRWSGAGLLVGGLLCAISFLFHPLADDFSAIVGTRWLVVHNLAGVGLMLILPGLAGLYGYLGEKNGSLGLVAFIVASIATGLMGGLLFFIESIILPVAAANPAFASLADPASDLYRGTLVIPVYLGTCLLLAIGYVLLGMAVLRSSDFPRIAGYLIIVGGFLSALPVPPAPVIVVITGVFLLGTGLATVGFVLWRSTSRETVSTKITAGVQP